MADLFGMPWPMWTYLAVGLPIAYWFQGRENNHSERYLYGRARFLFMLMLALLWPILLLSMSINWLHKPKRKGDSSE